MKRHGLLTPLYLFWILLFNSSVSLAASVKPVNQQPTYYTTDLGGVVLTSISDGTVPQDLHTLLSASQDLVDHMLTTHFLENPVEASINVFLVRLEDRLILVDTGAGEIFGPGFGGELPTTLKHLGISPNKITDILITHIHSDHSGGLIKDGKRLFPNATLHIAKADVDFFLNPANAKLSGYDKKYFEQAAGTVGPYIKSGQVKTFLAPQEILPGITAHAFPGHTPGSTLYRLRQGAQEVAFLGDLLHVESVQFPRPDITIIYDVVPAQAVSSRIKAFTKLVEDRVLVAAPHLSYPGLGHITQGELGYKWIRTDFIDRGRSQ